MATHTLLQIMRATVVWSLGLGTVVFTQKINGHGFLLKDYIRDYTKLQEGPLCARLRDP